jgi:hypothetical protein
MTGGVCPVGRIEGQVGGQRGGPPLAEAVPSAVVGGCVVGGLVGTRGFMGGGWGDGCVCMWDRAGRVGGGSRLAWADQRLRPARCSGGTVRAGGSGGKGCTQAGALKGGLPGCQQGQQGGSAHSDGRGKENVRDASKPPCLPRTACSCLLRAALVLGGQERGDQGQREGGWAEGPRTQDRAGALCYNTSWTGESKVGVAECTASRGLLGTGKKDSAWYSLLDAGYCCWVLFAGWCV